MADRKVFRDSCSELKWSIEKRLEFIDFRLFWEGRINRSDLTEQFGISIPQASSDLSRYQGLAPTNVTYDPSQKCYLAASKFLPVFRVDDSNRYFTQLSSIANRTITVEAAWLNEAPSFRMVPIPGRRVDTVTLKAVLRGIRECLALEIRYQSMSRPEPRWRWITPHALGFDGFRWHVRAFCHSDETFKDFTFARIQNVGHAKPHAIDPSSDRDWFTSVALRIAPHPGLSEGQRRAVELDYDMQDGVSSIHVPKAFLYYCLKRLGFNGDLRRRRPEDQQIVLLNRKAVWEALSGKSSGH